MDTRTLRATRVTLPDLHEDDLDEVDSLDRDNVREFAYSDAHHRELWLARTHLMNGRITSLTTQRARWDDLHLHSVAFSNCDLSGLKWTGSTLSRVTFTDCKLMGAILEDLTLKDVLFERCRLDYATLTRLRTTGPVIVSSSSLREATITTCDMTRATLNECDLHLTTIEGGTWARCDLRGNDLADIQGVASLKNVTLDRSQLPALADAFATALGVVFGEDLDES
ncbi:pentapeptide repeat-containing protein [Microtetraspora malaysiensis]|uniref:Pentapeptide repeat-containing protein n=1 Tax=Microtetraspora malaysiensis TaxID=161358 RepID=A0ABW6SNU5_9ACTN